MSALFGFRAAHDTGIPIKPIVNISFASPYVGDSEFQQHFEALEKQGKIRHLRVTNKDNVVSLAPSISLHRNKSIHHQVPLCLYRIIIERQG